MVRILQTRTDFPSINVFNAVPYFVLQLSCTYTCAIMHQNGVWLPYFCDFMHAMHVEDKLYAHVQFKQERPYFSLLSLPFFREIVANVAIKRRSVKSREFFTATLMTISTASSPLKTWIDWRKFSPLTFYPLQIARVVCANVTLNANVIPVMQVI